MVSILTNTVDEKAFYSGIKVAQISEAAHKSIVKANLERLKKQKEEYEKAKLEKYNEEQILLHETNEKNGKVREESHSRRDSTPNNFVVAKHISVPKIFRRLSRGRKDANRHTNELKQEEDHIPIPTKIFRRLSRSSNGSRKADVDLARQQSEIDLENRSRLANRRSKRIEKILGSEASLDDIDYHSSRSQ